MTELRFDRFYRYDDLTAILRGFGGKTEFWEYNLESFTLMAGLAAITEKIKIYATCPTLVIPPAFCARIAFSCCVRYVASNLPSNASSGRSFRSAGAAPSASSRFGESSVMRSRSAM